MTFTLNPNFFLLVFINHAVVVLWTPHVHCGSYMSARTHMCTCTHTQQHFKNKRSKMEPKMLSSAEFILENHAIELKTVKVSFWAQAWVSCLRVPHAAHNLGHLWRRLAIISRGTATSPTVSWTGAGCIAHRPGLSPSDPDGWCPAEVSVTVAFWVSGGQRKTKRRK